MGSWQTCSGLSLKRGSTEQFVSVCVTNLRPLVCVCQIHGKRKRGLNPAYLKGTTHMNWFLAKLLRSVTQNRVKEVGSVTVHELCMSWRRIIAEGLVLCRMPEELCASNPKWVVTLSFGLSLGEVYCRCSCLW